MNVALLAGLALLPCVVLVGMLTDAGLTLPADIAPAAMRGTFEGSAATTSAHVRAP